MITYSIRFSFTVAA